MTTSAPLSAQLKRLHDYGYVIARGFVPQFEVQALHRVAQAQLLARAAPLELEADLRYPGAPTTRTATGGDTVRRLLDAYGREPLFSDQATRTPLRTWLEAYFGESALLSRAHHNCLMTKHPLYGSMTGWHRDMRYWSFERDDLISAWIAIGVEEPDNGGLWFVPRSNKLKFDEHQFDAAKFFRTDPADNAALLAGAESPRLSAGDVVFFHCNTLHSAGTNLSDAVKFSLVFTYHGRSNSPVAGTRSAALPEIAL